MRAGCAFNGVAFSFGAPHDKAAGDADGRDVVIDDHQAALFIHSRNTAASDSICSGAIRSFSVILSRKRRVHDSGLPVIADSWAMLTFGEAFIALISVRSALAL
jgi:hypothetical protein